MKLQQLRPSRSGQSRGLILALPGIHGTHADVVPLTRSSLPHYDIWAASVELNGARVDDAEVWLDFARRVVEAVLASAIARPAAMFGFSIGGYLGWLIDRILVGAGLPPTPVVNLDGGVLHLQRKRWVDAVPAMLPRSPDLPAAKILLAHSAMPGALKLPDSSLADWQRLGVTVHELPFRTVDHPDFKRPAAIAAAATMFDTFIETGELPAGWGGKQIDIGTAGNAVFQALVAPDPPSVAMLEPIVSRALSVNQNVLASLLFLSLATGDADYAIHVSRRAEGISPRFWPATYAAIAALRAAGREADAAERAERWRRANPGKSRPGLGPRRVPPPAGPWGSLRGEVLGSEASLDFAAAFCRPRAAAQAPGSP
jgi:hypothetical protein